MPKEWLSDDYDIESISGINKDELDIFKHNDWENCLEVEPLESHESFRIMEEFALQLINIPMQNKLIQALSNRKPFANFKRIIDNSTERQNWFGFKELELQKFVRTQIHLHLSSKSVTKCIDENSYKPNTLPF